MNAKKELLKHIAEREVEYVQVRRYILYYEKVLIKGSLHDVLPRMDFEYYNGYGSQELQGTVWYTDGTWSERCEYDGSEWWEHRKRPPLPK